MGFDSITRRIFSFEIGRREFTRNSGGRFFFIFLNFCRVKKYGWFCLTSPIHRLPTLMISQFCNVCVFYWLSFQKKEVIVTKIKSGCPEALTKIDGNERMLYNIPPTRSKIKFFLLYPKKKTETNNGVCRVIACVYI